MKTKKDFLTKLLALLIIGGMFACSDDENDNTSVNTPTAEEFNLNDEGTGVTFDQEAVILGVSGNDATDMGVSLMYLLSNIKQEVTDNTKLLIVPELSSKYEDAITKVYENGGVVAVTNPSESQILKWFEDVDWKDGFMPGHVDDALMFSFGQGFHCCVVYGPDNEDIAVDSTDVANMPDKDSEGFIFKPLLEAQAPVTVKSTGVDASSAGEDVWTDFESSKYPAVYSYLSSWMNTVNKSFEEKDVVDEDETEKVKKLFAQKVTRADGDKADNDVSLLFSKYTYSVVLPFHAHAQQYEVLWSDPDYITGDGSVSLNFNIYQIHVYDEAPGCGDYYLVNMSAALESDRMYKGKWVNMHGGVWVRLCGYYAMAFAVDCIPWNIYANAPFTNDDVELVGAPSPETTQGETVYTTQSSFSLNISGSVSAGKNFVTGANRGLGQGRFLSGNLSVAAGWSWTDSKSRNVSDTDISNTSGAYVVNGQPQPIARAGWKMVFNNYPKFEFWGNDCGYNEGNSQTYRSTNYLDASWIWRAKYAKDFSTSSPIAIKVRTQPTYGSMVFWGTEEDLEYHTYNHFGAFDYTFYLSSFSRDRCSTVNIENDFEDGTSITSIEINRVNKSTDPKNTPWHKLVWSTEKTIKPGNSVTSAALSTADTYHIYINTNDGHRYMYSKGDSDEKTLEEGTDNTVYSSLDFNKKIK